MVAAAAGDSSRNIGPRGSGTHKARRVGKGYLGWSAAARGRARTSGSAGSGSASGPCSVCFLQTDKKTHRVKPAANGLN